MVNGCCSIDTEVGEQVDTFQTLLAPKVRVPQKLGRLEIKVGWLLRYPYGPMAVTRYKGNQRDVDDVVLSPRPMLWAMLLVQISAALGCQATVAQTLHAVTMIFLHKRL